MTEIHPWKCTECGRENPAGSRRCSCGDGFPSPESFTGGKPKSKLWIAALPGLIVLALATGGIIYQFTQMRKASNALVPGGASSGGTLECVETYGITLHTSEFYVSEGLTQFKHPKNAPRELSTVLNGVARNNCGKPLNNVRIRIRVRSADGKRGDAWATVGTLETGEAKPFERAWMGPVTTYEIAEIR